MTIDQTSSGPGDLQFDGRDKLTETSEGDVKTALARERSNFAKFRTSLALDRTTLAWIRTALTFATFGFGVVGFFRSLVQMTHSEQAAHLHQAAIHFGVALIVIGLVSTILAAFSHWIILRRLRRGEELSVTQWPLAITIAVFISVLGLCALWFMFNP